MAEKSAYLTVVALAACCECVYLLYFVPHYPLVVYYRGDIDMGQMTGYAHAAFVNFVVMFTLLFAIVGSAWWIVHDLEQRKLLWLVLGCGAVFGVTMTFVYPITAIDVFTYIDQSWIMVHYHQNPIFTPPASYPSDHLMALSDGWSGTGAPYGPLGIVIDALPTIVTGGSLLANLIALKLMFSGMVLVDAYLVYLILLRLSPRYAIGGAMLVAWNPLVIFETSANGHNDVAMMLFALLALLSVAEGELVLGPLLLVTSALVKYATGLLIPLVLAYGITRQQTWRRRSVYLAGVCLGGLVMIGLAYAPFWHGLDTFRRSLAENQLYVASFGSVLSDLLRGHIRSDQAALLGRVLFIPVYLAALRLSTRSFEDLMRGCFLAIFGFLALGVTNFKIWYAIWPALLAAALPRLSERFAALVFGYAATLSATFYGYIWVWLGLAAPGNFTLVNTAAYLFDFLPAALALVAINFWKPVLLGLTGQTDSPPPIEAKRETS